MDTAVFATLKKLIGKKNDTGGTATDGTVNGKLNAVISNTSASTSANSSGTLSQKLSYIISTLIGSANATGGSATAGTVMGKLNALLSSWTAARAGYLDNIRSYTITNNSASSTGVLSQKLSYLISQRQASQTGTGITVYSGSITSATYSDRYICIAKFVAPVSGVYKVTVTSNAQSYSSNIEVRKIITATASYCYNATSNNYSYVGGRTIDQNASYDASSVNSLYLGVIIFQTEAVRFFTLCRVSAQFRQAHPLPYPKPSVCTAQPENRYSLWNTIPAQSLTIFIL